MLCHMPLVPWPIWLFNPWHPGNWWSLPVERRWPRWSGVSQSSGPASSLPCLLHREFSRYVGTCFAFSEYLAGEIYWALYSLYVALLLPLDNYGHTDQLSGCFYIQDQGLLVIRGYQNQRFSKEIGHWGCWKLSKLPGSTVSLAFFARVCIRGSPFCPKRSTGLRKPSIPLAFGHP